VVAPVPPRRRAPLVGPPARGGRLRHPSDHLLASRWSWRVAV